MKLNKLPKRRGPPSDKFLAKSRPHLLVPPSEGPVRIYLDDSRACPEGWTVARTSTQFAILLSPSEPSVERVTHLSLDYQLGRKDSMNGLDVVNWLGGLFLLDSGFLPNLESIGLHSSSRERAIEMDAVLNQFVPEDRKSTFFVQWGTPRLPQKE